MGQWYCGVTGSHELALASCYSTGCQNNSEERDAAVNSQNYAIGSALAFREQEWVSGSLRSHMRRKMRRSEGGQE